jgi:hypothetical protein
LIIIQYKKVTDSSSMLLICGTARARKEWKTGDVKVRHRVPAYYFGSDKYPQKSLKNQKFSKIDE